MNLNPLQDGKLTIASVVFATDFTPSSQKAGAYAALLARHFQAELIIVHAFLLNQSAIEVEMLKQQPSEERLHKLSALEEVADTFRAEGLRVQTKLLNGIPAHEIPAFADSQPQPLLVLGTQRENKLERALLGSTAEGCLRRVAAPTITVGPRVRPVDSAHPFHSILYATDCSGMATHAAPFVWAMAHSFQSELRVITVVEEHHSAIAEVLTNLDFRMKQEITERLGSACKPALESRTVASPARARNEILNYAAGIHSDLLILGVHRRASIEIFDRNSITIQLIEQAACPVLTLTRLAVTSSDSAASGR